MVFGIWKSFHFTLASSASLPCSRSLARVIFANWHVRTIFSFGISAGRLQRPRLWMGITPFYESQQFTYQNIRPPLVTEVRSDSISRLRLFAATNSTSFECEVTRVLTICKPAHFDIPAWLHIAWLYIFKIQFYAGADFLAPLYIAIKQSSEWTWGTSENSYSTKLSLLSVKFLKRQDFLSLNQVQSVDNDICNDGAGDLAVKLLVFLDWYWYTPMVQV